MLNLSFSRKQLGFLVSLIFLIILLGIALFQKKIDRGLIYENARLKIISPKSQEKTAKILGVVAKAQTSHPARDLEAELQIDNQKNRMRIDPTENGVTLRTAFDTSSLKKGLHQIAIYLFSKDRNSRHLIGSSVVDFIK